MAKYVELFDKLMKMEDLSDGEKKLLKTIFDLAASVEIEKMKEAKRKRESKDKEDKEDKEGIEEDKDDEDDEEDKEKDKEDTENEEKEKYLNSNSNLSLVEAVVAKKKKGKVFEKKGDSMIRARNLTFSYDPDVSKAEIMKILRQKISKGVLHPSESDNTVNVYYKKKVCVKSLKGYAIGGKTPIVRTFSYDMMKNSAKTVGAETGGKHLLAFLLENSPENLKNLEESIKISLESTKILHHSEYLLSCVFFSFIYSIGISSAWEKINIIALDSKLEDSSVDAPVKPFRCDLVFFFADCLYIVEHKFKYNRPANMGAAAMQCIEDRDYVYKVVSYIMTNQPKLLISRIVGLGVGYNVCNGLINCNVVSVEVELPKIEGIEIKRKLIQEKRDSNLLLKNKRQREMREEKREGKLKEK